MTISARMIEHSVAPHGIELITLELYYPYRIHAELMTHRQVGGPWPASLSSSSTRATPYKVMRKMVMDNPYIPLVWPKAGKGMQPREEFPECDREFFKTEWLAARDEVVLRADRLDEAGVHKSEVTTLITPWLHMKVLVTSTEWANFFALRLDKEAKFEMQTLAKRMAEAIRDSEPVARYTYDSPSKRWHLPYVTQEEREEFPDNKELFLCKISAGRSARLSFFTEEGRKPSPKHDLNLYDRLVSGDHVEASPLEHQGYPNWYANEWSGNFRGWDQFRKMIPNESQPNFDWRKRLEEYGDREYIL